MDYPTIQYYQQHAAETAAKYRSVDLTESRTQFRELFSSGGRILDIGTGSGRDAAALLSLGFEAFGLEPSEAMRAEAIAAYPQLSGRIFPYGLPLPEDADLGGPFDGLVCSAVLMHVPEEEWFEAAFSLKRLLRHRGRLWISVPLDRPGLDSECRDTAGRLFKPLHPEYLLLLFERLGFKLLRRLEEDDKLGRTGIRWASFLFELDVSRGKPLDRIEGVLNRDRKTATYKLALFRALSDIAGHHTQQAKWLPSGEVAVPLRLIAEKWFQYYWPIFESPEFIPQNNGEQPGCTKPVAFRRKQEALIEAYRNRGGLSQFLVDQASGDLNPEVEQHFRDTLITIEQTIRKGPVVYSSGNLFRNERGHVVVDPGAWSEFCQLGHWIEPAVVLRWAEETNRMSGGQIAGANILHRLLVNPTEERNVGAAREAFERMEKKRCVWTDRELRTDYAIDHVIPFSLWHCNDLWNLLPCDLRINGSKSDKLPKRALLLKRKEAIIFYWEQVREQLGRRFDHDMSNFIGGRHGSPNWQSATFQRLVEAVEFTAVQRGADRWCP